MCPRMTMIPLVLLPPLSSATEDDSTRRIVLYPRDQRLRGRKGQNTTTVTPGAATSTMAKSSRDEKN
jgi:hypothetical protein